MRTSSSSSCTIFEAPEPDLVGGSNNNNSNNNNNNLYNNNTVSEIESESGGTKLTIKSIDYVNNTNSSVDYNHHQNRSINHIFNKWKM